MKKWTDEFISRTLDGLPKDNYRQRAQAELTDHLLELADELESGGYSPEEAQIRALELMGEPEQLKQSFQRQWRNQVKRLGFLLPHLTKASFHGFLFRIFVRLILIYPILTVGEKLLPTVSLPDSISLLLLGVVNFWPGTQFVSAESHRVFSLLDYQKRRSFSLQTSVLSWIWEVLLISVAFFIAGFSFALVRARELNGIFVGGEYDPVIHSYFLFITGQGPLVQQDSFLYLGSYFIVGLVVCVVFPLLYRPRCASEVISPEPNK